MEIQKLLYEFEFGELLKDSVSNRVTQSNVALNQIVSPDSSESNSPLLSPQPMISSCKKDAKHRRLAKALLKSWILPLPVILEKTMLKKMIQICSFVKVRFRS